MGYAASKNHANNLASNDWILSLDADEELSPPLIDSLQKWKEKLSPAPAGFNRLTNYCGQWIRHCGWYPDFKFRVFNRNQFQWKGDIHEVLAPTSSTETQIVNWTAIAYILATIRLKNISCKLKSLLDFGQYKHSVREGSIRF
jgi:hypothetical protein